MSPDDHGPDGQPDQEREPRERPAPAPTDGDQEPDPDPELVDPDSGEEGILIDIMCR